MREEIDDWTPSLEPMLGPDLSRPLLLVHFWAPWNLHDRSFDQTMCILREEFGHRFHFASQNVDAPRVPESIVAAKILNVPALAFFRAGTHIETVIGNRDPDSLRTTLSSWLLAHG